MKSAVIGASPARPRMPSVPKYFLSTMSSCPLGVRESVRAAQRAVAAECTGCNGEFRVKGGARPCPAGGLHRVRRPLGGQDTGQDRFDLGARGIAVGRFVELHAD